MIENLSKAFLIAGLGMGLVFIGILLLWGLMALMIRIPFHKREQTAQPRTKNEPALVSDDELLRKAVAAAVVTAIALQNAVPSLSSHATKEALTPWQSVHRARQFQSPRNPSQKR